MKTKDASSAVAEADGASKEGVQMKRKPLLPICLSAVAVLILSGIAPVQAESEAAASRDDLITVLNPAVTEKLAERVPLAPRLDTLESKTIYVVDMNYEGFGLTPVLEEMQTWFAENVPGVKTILKLKSGSYISDDPALWKEIAANGGDGVIMGVAG
jgi:hypothetical protein